MLQIALLCELGSTCSKAYLHREEAILRQIFQYILIYMHANEAGAASGCAVCVHFNLCACFVACTLSFSLICTGSVDTKTVQSFCEFAPYSLEQLSVDSSWKRSGRCFNFLELEDTGTGKSDLLVCFCDAFDGSIKL